METLAEKAQRLGIKPAGTPETLVQKAQRLGIKPATVEAKTPGYFSRVSSAFSEAGQNIVSEVKKAATPTDSVLGDVTQLGRTVLRGVGEVAGAAFAPIVEAPIIKPAIEAIGKKITSFEPVKDLITSASELAKQYPEQAKDLEAVANIIGFGVGKAAYAPIKGEIKAVGKDVAQAASIALTPSEQTIQQNVISLFQKSIKPTAKKTLAQGQKYDNNVVSALKTIKSNADQLNIEDAAGELVSGRTPATINELAQGVEQTKKVVFKQYDDLAKQANKTGVTIKATPIADEVLKVSQSKALQITNPEVVKYAESWAERLRTLGEVDTETTQAVIQNLNQNLQAFYKNPTYESASKVAVDAGVANNFRKALDEAIEGATGKEYQTLKNQYAALKAIEADVVRAAMRDARKNVKGLLDYTDIFTSGQMLSGILSLSPAMFAKGAIERGFKEYFKFLNDPNRAIANIFEQLDVNPSQSFQPSSATFKTVQGIKNTPNKQGGFVKNPLKRVDIPKNITPESAAKKIDDTDAIIIDNYLRGSNSVAEKDIQSILRGMGVQNADVDIQDAFLKEVMDEYGRIGVKTPN